MFLGIFETKQEKEIRFSVHDAHRKLQEIKAKEQGIPFFGSKFIDDDRKKTKTDTLNQRLIALTKKN